MTDTMIDWHCHLLPGVDDGPRRIEDALLMARMLAESGFTTVCCTPHCIRGAYDNTPETVRNAVALLQETLLSEGIRLTLVPGLEYLLDDCFLDEIRNPLPLPGNQLLVEIPSRSDPEFVKNALFAVVRKGLRPLIAHPERCELLSLPSARKPGFFGRLSNRFVSFAGKDRSNGSGLFEYLKDLHCGFQGNIGSFAGLYGEKVGRTANVYRQSGLYTCFGSDLHSPEQKAILQKSADLISDAKAPVGMR